MSKERDIQILEFKIAELEDKIYEYQDHAISQRKIDKLNVLQTKYGNQLAVIEAS